LFRENVHRAPPAGRPAARIELEGSLVSLVTREVALHTRAALAAARLEVQFLISRSVTIKSTTNLAGL
jgi:hypothetical protein